MNETQSTPSLDHLLARCALADGGAFAELYAATSAKLFAVVLRILKNRELAEDALQDVYIRIWQSAADYHAGRGAVMTWMTSIARYRAIDMLRRANAGIKVSAGDADAVDTQHAPGAGPVEFAVQQAANTRLTACLDELDPPRRTCLVLAYCDGYTHDELSVKLGSPVGTIKSWIRRGLLALKACLGGGDD